MAALTKSRNTKERTPSVRQYVAAGTIYAGGLVALNSSGAAVAASDASGLAVVGMAMMTVSSGSTVSVKSGCFLFRNASGENALAAKDAGSVCYVSDDQTVTKAAGTYGIVAGKVYDVDSSGVWVIVGELRADSRYLSAMTFATSAEVTAGTVATKPIAPDQLKAAGIVAVDAATTTAAGKVKMAANVALAVGEAPTKAEYDALITALINAGSMAAGA